MSTSPTDAQVEAALQWLMAHNTQATLHGLARFAIPSEHAHGVAMKKSRSGKVGRTGMYEARMQVSFVGEPAKINTAQMDQGCRTFDNWALCDCG